LARFLAIDWDQNQLHVVAAEVGGKGAVRVKKAVVWHEPRVPNIALAEDLGKLLKERLKEAGLSPAPVLACVGRDRLIVKEVRYPAVPEVEEPAVIRFQAVKELTESADDVIIDYVLAGSARTTLTSDRKAVALVIRKEVLETYRVLCEAAGLKLAGLTPRLLGVPACLRKVMGTTVLTPAPTPPDGVVTVVVAGEKHAEISILKGDLVLLTRSVPNNAALPGEIRRNLAVHAGQTPHMPVVAIYLTGKGSGELRQKLGEQSELPVYTFDPFAASGATEVVEVGATLTPPAAITPADKLDVVDTPRGPGGTRGTFSGPMGLLYLKSAGELPVNFVSPKQPKPPVNANYRHLRLALVGGIAVVLGLFVLGRVLYANAKADLDAVTEYTQTIEKQLNDTRANAKRLKEIDDWDAPVWLDEFYDLTARIADVNVLRILSIQTEFLPHSQDSKAVARATIKGKLLNRGERRPLNELVTKFRQDLYYTVEAPKVENDTFTLVVKIERRPPSEYKAVVKEQPATKGFGGFGGFGKGKKQAAAEEDDEDGDGKADKAKEKQAGAEKTKGRQRRPGGNR
jgi:Tfp pilus assembly PilM family ATPase